MKGIVNRVLCFFLIAALACSFAIPSEATSIQDAKEEKESLQEDLEKAQETIDALKNEKGDIESYVKKLDSQLNELSANLEKTKAELEKKEASLEETRVSLEQAKAEEETQYQSMKIRIKYMYEQGNTAYIEMLLSAENISEIMNKAEYIAKISEYDRNMLVRYQETKTMIAEQEMALTAECEEIKMMKAELAQEQAYVEELITEKSSELEKYEKSIADTEQLAKEYEAEIEEQTAIIKELEEAAALAKKKAAEAAAKAAAEAAKAAAGGTSSSSNTSANASVSYDGGKFSWPCPSSTRVTSDYGYRTHPVLGGTVFHSGIDIGAATGSSIVAAYGGSVVSAAYNSTMGNYVMLDHGDGLYTIYMHASSLLVSSGQNVSKGQTIALVGSTGRSTGPHLHFGVRLNGSYVTPWNYLSR